MDHYISINGWNLIQSEADYSVNLDTLAYSLSRIRKTIMELDSQDIEIIVQGYLINF